MKGVLIILITVLVKSIENTTCYKSNDNILHCDCYIVNDIIYNCRWSRTTNCSEYYTLEKGIYQCSCYGINGPHQCKCGKIENNYNCTNIEPIIESADTTTVITEAENMTVITESENITVITESKNSILLYILPFIIIIIIVLITLGIIIFYNIYFRKND